MDQLQLNTHSSHRNKFICSHKNQEKKDVQIAEGLAGAGDPRALARVDGNIHCQFHTENPGGQIKYWRVKVKSESRVISLDPCRYEINTSSYFITVQRQFCVMMTPSDALLSASQRTIAPHTHPYTVDELNTQHHDGFNWRMDSLRTTRDERRRAQHNEVERRRRDKINNWIVTLSKMIPDCGIDGAKTAASKGGILSKACDYISELKQQKQRLQESLRRTEREDEMLRQQLEELKSENGFLRAQLEHHGIDTLTQ